MPSLLPLGDGVLHVELVPNLDNACIGTERVDGSLGFCGTGARAPKCSTALHPIVVATALHLFDVLLQSSEKRR